jgi:outer membrane protein OmpA-like peptidoglycan-associated protein
MRKIIQWAGMAGLALALAGCDLSGIGGSATAPPAGPSVTISADAAPSALISVLSEAAFGPALTSLVDATAQSREDLTVLRAGTPPQTVLSSDSPAPSAVVVAGEPAPRGRGETAYQAAQYAERLARWHDEIAAGKRAEATETRDALSGWLRGLALSAKTERLADPPGQAGSLAAECADAASVLAGLAEADGDVFGSRRVLVLYSDDLSGRPPVGSLTGDTVLVITPFVPTGAAASAVQADLLAAGAAQAAVAGPEVTGGQLAAFVSAGLNQGGEHDSVSAPVLFANDSAALSQGAIAQLSALLPRLHQAGATAVINGFASTTGTAPHNYALSYERAAAAAVFFESKGIPASSLLIVGHGASDPVAPGTSPDNRRLTVVIETP